MIRWLFELLTDDQLRIPEREAALPSCVVRPLREEDMDRCHEMYRLNESNHYPGGLYEDFKSSLRDAQRLVLVVEKSGDVVGCGAICMDTDLSCAMISYGIIHPDYQRRGFGTVLLLSRLSILPEPLDSWTVGLTTAGPSASFYQRFGFLRAGATRVPRTDIKVDFYKVILFRKSWGLCQKCLSESEVVTQLSGVTIPSVDFVKLAAREME